MSASKCLLFILFLGLGAKPLAAQKDSIHWLSFEEWHKKQKVNPKPSLIFIYTEWCKYCKVQEKESFASPEIIACLNKDYYALRLNAEEKKSIRFLNRDYHFNARGFETGQHALAQLLASKDGEALYPSTLILNSRNQIVYRKSALIQSSELQKVLAQLR